MHSLVRSLAAVAAGTAVNAVRQRVPGPERAAAHCACLSLSHLLNAVGRHGPCESAPLLRRPLLLMLRAADMCTHPFPRNLQRGRRSSSSVRVEFQVLTRSSQVLRRRRVTPVATGSCRLMARCGVGSRADRLDASRSESRCHCGRCSCCRLAGASNSPRRRPNQPTANTACADQLGVEPCMMRSEQHRYIYRTSSGTGHRCEQGGNPPWRPRGRDVCGWPRPAGLDLRDSLLHLSGSRLALVAHASDRTRVCGRRACSKRALACGRENRDRVRMMRETKM